MGRRFVPMSTILRRMQDKDDRCARELAKRFPTFLESEVLPYAAVEIVHVPVSDVERTIEDAQRHDAIERCALTAPKPVDLTPVRCVGPCRWVWVTASILKCTRCGYLKRAEK